MRVLSREDVCPPAMMEMMLTERGLEESERLFEKLFAKA